MPTTADGTQRLKHCSVAVATSFALTTWLDFSPGIAMLGPSSGGARVATP